MQKGMSLGENQLMLIWRPFFNASGTEYERGSRDFGHLMMWTGSSLPVNSVRGLAERKSQFLSFSTKQDKPLWNLGSFSSAALGHQETCNHEAGLLEYCQNNGETASYRIFEVADCDCGCTPGKKIVEGITAEIKKINTAFTMNFAHQYLYHGEQAQAIREKYKYSAIGSLETESKNCASIILSLIAEHGGPHECHRKKPEMNTSDRLLAASIVSCAIGGTVLLGVSGAMLCVPLALAAPAGLPVVIGSLVMGGVSGVGGIGLDLMRRGMKFEHWAKSVKPKCVLNRDLGDLAEWAPKADLLCCFLNQNCFRLVDRDGPSDSHQGSSEPSQ